MKAILNSKVIQPKPAPIDDDTDRTLCKVFIELLQKVRQEHDALVEQFGDLGDDDKFYSTYKDLDSITPSLLTAVYK